MVTASVEYSNELFPLAYCTQRHRKYLPETKTIRPKNYYWYKGIAYLYRLIIDIYIIIWYVYVPWSHLTSLNILIISTSACGFSAFCKHRTLYIAATAVQTFLNLSTNTSNKNSIKYDAKICMNCVWDFFSKLQMYVFIFIFGRGGDYIMILIFWIWKIPWSRVVIGITFCKIILLHLYYNHMLVLYWWAMIL